MSSEPIAVQSPWTGATPPNATTAAGYLTIVNNTDAAIELVQATSPRAAAVSIHNVTTVDGMMQMRPVERVSIAAGERLTFSPEGMHLMFEGIRGPFKPGEQIPATLVFDPATPVEATFEVKDLHDVHAGH